MPSTLEISVDNLDSVLQLYNRIQILRSTTGIDGVYSEITSDSPQPPSLTGGVSGPFAALNTKVLNVSMNGADPVAILFTGTNPIPLTQVLDTINLVITGLATASAGKLKLTGPLSGTGSSLVVSGTAVAILGLPASAQGTGARIPMGLQNNLYTFVDLAGTSTYYYKTRFYSTVTQGVSSFSDPFVGALTEVPLQTEDRVKATVNLMDGAGIPVVGQRIILVPVSQVNVTSTTLLNYGVLPGADRIIIQTDGSGHAETNLLVGLTVRVFFEGSGYAREFVVPDEDFDLLTVLSTQPDPFSIVQAPPMPIRES